MTDEVLLTQSRKLVPPTAGSFNYIKAQNQSQTSRPETGEESALTTRIIHLWSEQKVKSAVAKHTREELSKLRADFGQELFTLKQRFAKAGRNGAWLPFLRDNGIPRATAERWIERHKLTLAPRDLNCLTETIPPPSAAAVTRMVTTLTPKLLKLLTTSESISQFIAEIKKALIPDNVLSHPQELLLHPPPSSTAVESRS